MKRLSVLAPLAALALTACDSKDGVEAKNESPESVARKVAAADVKPRPGRWQGTFKLESMEMPGMPPQARAQMHRSIGGEQTYFTCLTAEQAAKPDASFFQKSAPGCVYDAFSMAGGRLNAQMTCPAGNGPTVMTMAGSYGENDYDLKITGKGELQKGMAMTMSVAVAMHRVGECNGTESQ